MARCALKLRPPPPQMVGGHWADRAKLGLERTHGGCLLCSSTILEAFPERSDVFYVLGNMECDLRNDLAGDLTLFTVFSDNLRSSQALGPHG